MSVETECAHCSQPMHVEINSDLDYSVRQEGADPLVLVPEVDLYKPEETSIIQSF